MASPDSPTLPLELALQQAIGHHQAGRLWEAEQLYRAILQAQPRQAEANHKLGMIACQVGQHAAGLPYLQTAYSIDPKRAEYALTYADALLKTGRSQEALLVLQSAAPHVANSAAAQSLEKEILSAIQNRSDPGTMTPAEMQRLALLFNEGRYAEMETAARTLVERHPQSGIAWKAFGTAQLKQRKNALPALQRAAALLPNDAQTFCNLGNAQAESGQGNDALRSYRRALEIEPAYVEAHFGLGRALQDSGQLEDALTSYRRALEIKPDFMPARCNLLFALQFSSQSTKEDLFVAHRRFGEQVEASLKPHWPVHANSRDPDKRLKIGYVSGDFREHAVAYFIEPVLSNHDKSQVEVYCYSNSAKRDAVTERLIAQADHWQPCVGMSDDELAQHIRADGIDILVDLAGHTALNRLFTFARKPAPIQITYLGYPGSTGLSAMDYRLTDRYAEPGDDQYYTEKLLRLPGSIWCYRPPDGMPEVTPLPALVNGYLTFGSFNNVNKVGSECIALWASLLHRLPNSRLLMATVPEGAARGQLIRRFAQLGIADDRIDYCGSLPLRKFQRKLQQVDITLDPFPVNGATTTCESLWLGVPVLTMVGERFPSRAGLSIMNAARMPEFATATPEEFIEKAISLANDLPRLADIRAGMRERLKETPLFDQQRFARHFEAALRGMWIRWCESRREKSVDAARP
ncbi:MAG: tetratricopeptide repeat protein [Burkholderiaceae bacterium]|nr:tetratricopeptide repeat protein [Burkholderiaceae bacterium]